MLYILAQVSSSVYLISGAGGTLLLSSIIGWVVTRQIKKVVTHVDDPKIHLRPSNNYVQQTTCDERHENLIGYMGSMHDDIREIRKHLLKE